MRGSLLYCVLCCLLVTAAAQTTAETETDYSLADDSSSAPTATSAYTAAETTETDSATPQDTSITSSADTTTPKNVKTCQPDSCGISTATCVQLYETFVCQCPINFCFVNSTCEPGDSFYGTLRFPEMVFDAEKTSPIYTKIYKDVQAHFAKCFEGTEGYLGTVIIGMSGENIRDGVDVEVSVVHIFASSSVTAENVTDIISQYEKDNTDFGTYKNKSVCDGFYCDTATTTCKITDNAHPPLCTCKEGLFAYTETYTSCRACGPSCTGVGKHCVQELSTSVPVCKCQAGYKKDSDTCKICSFGLSGEECSDNSLLILVIVATVAGVLIIFTIGIIIGLSVRMKKNKSDNERAQLINKDISGNGTATGGLFPKVQAKIDRGHVNRAASPYEFTDVYSRNTPKPDYDEDPWYEMSKRGRD